MFFYKYKSVIVCILFLFLTQCAHHTRRSTLIIPDEMPQPAIISSPNVALVLGGGGSRGIAHLGVIEVLKENNVPIDFIVGTSAGSLIGALYADSNDITHIKSILFNTKRNELLDFSFFDSVKMFTSLTSLVRGQAYENFVFDNLNSKNFAELKTPLAIVTADSVTGEKFVITSGPIAPAVRSSSAIPPIIAPVNLYKRILFDGGVLEPVPVATAKKYNPKLIIAIDINTKPPRTIPANALDLTYRAFWMSYYQLSRMQAEQADIDIHPNLNGFGTFEDHRREALYNLGRKAAIAAMPEIKAKLKERKIQLKTNSTK